jgi:hypothetical protein
MLNLCSIGHDEICFEGRDCPACEIKTERDDFEAELEKLKEEVK